MTSFLIRGVRLFDGDNVTETTSVLVKDGLIAKVGPEIEAEGVPVIDKPGHTLLPGLIDAHVHPEEHVELSEQAMRFGITTLMDMQNRHADKQKQWARERKDLPDFKSAHSGATIENGWPAAVVKKLSGPEASDFDKWPNVSTEADAEPYIEKAVAAGSDYIKLFHEKGEAVGIPEGTLSQPSVAVQAAVVKAAHKRNLKVVAHALGLNDATEIIRTGIDGLAHTFFDKPASEEILELYKKHDPWVNPTLACVGVLSGESMELQETFAQDERVASRISPEQIKLLRTPIKMAADGAKWEYAIDSVRKLHAAGTRIIVGSDSAPNVSTIFGVTMHTEMYCLVHKAGLSTLETLRGATSRTASCFGWSDRGNIKPGLRADLLLVEGNPLDDITDLLNIRGIWREGVEFKGHSGFPRDI
ncbi:amidohydrolase family protein [Sarocladium implicatum]|nr:amidohydrolase family protein [Sarocladium implicatum]